MVQEDVQASECELITSKPILAGFELLVKRPFCSACLLTHAFFISIWTSSSYSALKVQPLHLEPYNTRLKSTVQSLRDDFGQNAEGMLSDAILIWSVDSHLQTHHNYSDLTQAVEKELKQLQNTDVCQKLKWKPAKLAKSEDAAVMRLDLHSKASIGHRNPCLYRIREYVQTVDSRFGKLNVAMAGPHSVVDASYAQCDSETLFHLTLSTPLLVLLLTLGVGTLPRSITPCFCLLGSVPASRSLVVLVKALWPDLNMVGPDTQILFVQLALAFDYALFFWVRFSQERRSRTTAEVDVVLMKTLQTSGFVILLSTSILVVTFLGASCYPDLNKLGYLYATLNLAFGSLFIGLYSITIPPVLASIFPSLFDEPHESNILSGWMQRGSKMVQRGFFRPVADVITCKPWNYVAPFLILACCSPLMMHIWHLRANFDVTLTDFSTSVPEYHAYDLVRKKFDDREGRQMTLLMTSSKLLGNSSDLVDTSDWTRSRPFQEAACHVARTVLKDDKCQSANVTRHEMVGYWWDSLTGSCVHSPNWHEKFISDDGVSQRMFMFPDIDNLEGAEAQRLIRHFWEVIEPKVSVQNGEGETLFSLHLYTPVAENMLLEAQYRRWAPWILGITLAMVCCMVTALFQSAFVGIKMVFTIALPIVAEYGFAVGVFQDGWLAWAGVDATGGLKWTMVHSTCGFLFALAMDYDLFLFARVYERRQQGYDNASAVRLSLEETGPLITLAGTIMVISFAFVLLSSVPVIAQMGCLYCFGVAFDVYVVRIFLAPAALCIFENMNYWPGKVPKPFICHPDKRDLVTEAKNYGTCD